MERFHKFKSFVLNESVDSGKTSAIKAFFSTLEDLIATHDLSFMDISYSYLANNKKRDPDVDLQIMLKALAEEGWTKGVLDSLFDKYADDVIEYYESGANPVVRTGAVDVLLYHLTGGKATLMGYDSEDSAEDNGVNGEAYIKFRYGYNRTPYGQLAMAQHFGSVDNFVDAVGSTVGTLLDEGGDEYDIVYSANGIKKILSEVGIVPSEAYSYDKATKTGTLDLNRWNGIISYGEKLLSEFCLEIGVPLEDEQYRRNDYPTGGRSTYDKKTNSIKMKFA